MVIVESIFLALTSTPSIEPSSTEVTRPVSEAGGWFSAPTKKTAAARRMYARMGALYSHKKAQKAQNPFVPLCGLFLRFGFDLEFIIDAEYTEDFVCSHPG